ncbi:MAG: histidine phosphatase family protein [Acidobacteria bacterium]|nr:histidine phosphatase family protein [Acidobacteriota bacterium]
MAITQLLLVRHGQSAKNVEGRFGGHSLTSLSELGRKQAEITAAAIAGEGASIIYSSDLPRAVQTASPLADRLNIEIIKTEAFRERHVGVLEGLTFPEAKKAHPNDYYALVRRDVNHKITDGESYRELLGRATGLLNDILRTYKGKKIVIFSHTGTICFVSLYLMNAIHSKTRTTPWLLTSNCGINRFEIRRRDNVRVVALNDTRHLHEITGNDSFSPK